MSEFDKWFKDEMPNSHKKVNKERIETAVYSCAEAAWDYQQAKINDSENTRAVLYRENIDIREKNIDLQAKIDELQKKYDAMYNAFTVADDCRKEWHESYMSARKERDELQARVDEALIEIVEKAKKLRSGNYLINEIGSALKGNKDERT